MPKLTHRPPTYRKHKASGQAIVTINGTDHYLGPWNSKASKAEYDRLIGEWLAHGHTLPKAGPDATLTMNELVMAATHSLESSEVAPHDVGFGLNDLLLSAIATKEDRGYGHPKEAFKQLSVEGK
jgi:hypothetical protein